MIAWGFSKKDIANKLDISERTVENHTRALYKKANVSKSNELAAWWFCKTYGIEPKNAPTTKNIFTKTQQDESN